jgi:hypothetical protein
MVYLRTTVTLICFVLLLAACDSSAEATPPPTPLPTATPLPTNTAVSVALPATPTTVLQSPITTSQSLTATDTISVAASSTATIASTTLRAAGGACLIKADLDLAGYQDLEEKLGCAVEAADFAAVGFNEFGPGPEYDRFMLWFEKELQIYVLLPDHRWEVFPDTWSEAQPTFTCNPLGGTPESPPLPRRGFNKVWCGVNGLSEIMGTVTVEERLCQHAVVQRFEQGRLLACYEDATIRYIRLRNDQTWDTVLAR